MAGKVIQRQTWFIALGESTRHDCLGPPAPLRVETLLRHIGMSCRPIAVTCRQLISKCPQLEKICCNSIQNSGFSIQSSRETLQDFRFPIQLQTLFTEEAKSQREPGGLDRAGPWRRRIPRLFQSLGRRRFRDSMGAGGSGLSPGREVVKKRFNTKRRWLLHAQAQPADPVRQRAPF